MELKYFVYFLLGGTLTSAITYLANNSRGLFAAFIATLPIISIFTFLLIYSNTGQEAALSYARGLIIMILPWILFILSIILLAPRMNFIYSLLIGACLQIVIAFWILRNFDKFNF